MPFTVTADPTIAFVDAVKTRLSADATLAALVTGIYGHLSEAARVAYPYLVLGRRTSGELVGGGPMGLDANQVSLQIDGWSDGKGPYAMSVIGSRVYAVLERWTPAIPGFVMVTGSLTREMQEVFDEPDEDKPNARLYRLVQRWTAEIHEAI